MAVQLLEQKRILNFSSLRYMAEQVRGFFYITILDARITFTSSRGTTHVSVSTIPSWGSILYASTQEILNQALAHLAPPLGTAQADPNQLW